MPSPPVDDRYRYGVVVGSVITAKGERGCNGEVWLQPLGAPVRDVRSIAPARLQNMFRFRSCCPGDTSWGSDASGSTGSAEGGGADRAGDPRGGDDVAPAVAGDGAHRRL
jgi:hypothetical protein